MNGQSWYIGYEDRLRVNGAIAKEVHNNRLGELAKNCQAKKQPVWAVMATWVASLLVRLGAA